MNEIEKLTTSEKAYEDYIKGMKYVEIAQKHNVSVNTIKSWKKRYKWERDCTTKKGCSGKSVQALGNNLYQEIREDLLTQLNANGTIEKRYIDLVEDYMALWDIKRRLIEDVKEHGVSIEWSNGKQVGKKKNDSVSDFIKVNEQMLKILTYLKLEPSPADKGDYDLEM